MKVKAVVIIEVDSSSIVYKSICVLSLCSLLNAKLSPSECMY